MEEVIIIGFFSIFGILIGSIITLIGSNYIAKRNHEYSLEKLGKEHKMRIDFMKKESFFKKKLEYFERIMYTLEEILTNWKVARTNPDPYLNKMTDRRTKFIREMTVNFGVSDGRIARDYRIFVSFSQVIDLKHDTYSDLISFRGQFINKLESLQLSPRNCNADDLIKLVRTMLQMELEPQENINYNKFDLLKSIFLKSCLNFCKKLLNNKKNIKFKFKFEKNRDIS